MKKNRTMRIATLMLALTLITCCFVGSTFAKYVSELNSVQDSARVALWAFDLGDSDQTDTTFDFELFSTINELDTYGNVSDVDEKDIDDALIAPGCGGWVAVTIANKSQVTAEYSVDFTAVENEVPLQWSTNNEDWEDSVDALDLTADGVKSVLKTATAANGDNSDKAEIKLYYKWDFSDANLPTNPAEGDTALGLAGTATPTINVKVTIEQVD